ncbi:MAG: FAD-dependent oxidoreductase, partial [Phycisphaerales bacterium]|nr:FAD-dependent oxidoreductase [Phycisphaerales bacterium]
PCRPVPPHMREIATDVFIVGGGVGGVAAMLACTRAGVRCLISEPTDWLGGQLTTQGVPPDENAWIETVGGTRTFQLLRSRVRESAIADGAGQREVEPFGAFNPGGGWVSRCCAEPTRWHAEIQRLIRETHAAALPGVEPAILLHHEPVAAEVSGDSIRSVTLRDTRSGECVAVTARLFLDATETGDLLPLSRAEHAIGAEHAQVYGELHGRTDFAPAQRLDPLDQQACSWCFALEHRPGEDHVVPKPAMYDWWRAYSPGLEAAGATGAGVPMTPPWTGPLFSWTVPSHNEAGRREFAMIPWPDEPSAEQLEMWRYRRIVDRSIWPSALQDAHPDITVINMVQMDYWQLPLLGVEPAERERALRGAREQSLCWLYWMQTEAPRHDSTSRGYPGLRLRGDELGTADGFAKSVYIREPRRLVARVMMHEGHIGTHQRIRDGHAKSLPNWSATPHGVCHPFADSIAIGHYPIDLHPSCAGRNNVYVPCTPYRIPMGSLIPVRLTNLLSAGKAIGVSHIVNATTRMHHSEWAIGEGAGTLASFCVRNGASPHAVHDSPAGIAHVRDALTAAGAPVDWPWER